MAMAQTNENIGFLEAIYAIWRTDEGKIFVFLLGIVAVVWKWGGEIGAWIMNANGSRRAKEEADAARWREMAETAAKEITADLKAQNARQEKKMELQDTRINEISHELSECKENHASANTRANLFEEHNKSLISMMEGLKLEAKADIAERRGLLERLEGQSSLIAKMAAQLSAVRGDKDDNENIAS